MDITRKSSNTIVFIIYDETYAPVAGFALVRLMLILMMSLGWVSRHVDIKTAFLNGKLEHDLYVRHPSLPKWHRRFRDKTFYKLLKALYGLHQAPRQWYIALIEYLVHHMGFVQLAHEASILMRNVVQNGVNIVIIVVIYVDDLIFMGNLESALVAEILKFLSRFEGSDQGELQFYLGVKVERTSKEIRLSQTCYIDVLLSQYKMQNCRSCPTPMTTNFYDELLAHADDSLVDDTVFRHQIGCFLYLSTRTRPDIMAATSILAQFVSRPTSFLEKCANRILRYLKGTRDYALMYTNDGFSFEFHGDSDFAGGKEDRKSRSGYCVMLNGNVFDWFSRKQDCAALSSAEAEYIALSEVCKEASWLHGLFADLKLPQFHFEKVRVKSDNQAAIAWSTKDHRS